MPVKSLIKPIGDRILVETITESAIQGGIYIPEAAKDKPTKGTVIAVGAGRRDERGQLHPVEVAVGDKVLTTPYAGNEIKLDGKTYRLLEMGEVLAMFN